MTYASQPQGHSRRIIPAGERENQMHFLDSADNHSAMKNLELVP
jgi:hypothetical protein